jgi:adenylate kinase
MPACVGVVLLGGPGSGKGTQAVRWAEFLGVPHISTGDLFRDHVERGTRLGVRAQRYMDAGELVPDDITKAMVRDRMHSEDTERGFILDGYPRTRAQAIALDAMLAQLGRRMVAAAHIRVSDAEIVNRLALRGRDDDTPRTVRARLRTFHRYHAPLIEYYREAGFLHEIDGEGHPDEVTARAAAAWEKLRGSVEG